MHLPQTQTPSTGSTTTTQTTESFTTETTTAKPTPTSKHNHKHLYFAYGSNLSPTQMTHRCKINPTLSSSPVALARLDGWSWFICEFGYANVLPPEHLRVGMQESASVELEKRGEMGVYGVLYEMDEGDEGLLDGYEAIDHASPPAAAAAVPGPGIKIRPEEQGIGDYNKWYLDATIVEWLDETQKEKRSGRDVQRVLVYVDEERVEESCPNEEYIPRMNRGIREAVQLGLSRVWVDAVMRRFIPDV